MLVLSLCLGQFQAFARHVEKGREMVGFSSCFHQHLEAWDDELTIPLQAVLAPEFPVGAESLQKTLAGRRMQDEFFRRDASQFADFAAVFLPGTFDVTRAERVTAGIGRCTVCDLDRAAYLDRATGTALCEYCYQRAMQAQGHGEVVG